MPGTPPDPNSQTDPQGPFTFGQIYRQELDELRAGVFAEPGAPHTAAHPDRDAALKRLYTEVHAKLDGSAGREPLAALCFSGGGIRSATFNLGVLQALARCGVLPRFDYLSTVSGGGYIGGWFQAWHRASGEDVFRQLGRKDLPANPLAPEPDPIDHLREYANYLTPRTGLFSLDLWTAVAEISRNLLLNWLVVIPVLAALLALPQLCLLFVRVTPRFAPWDLAIAGLILGFAAHLATFLYREQQLSRTAGLLRSGSAGTAPPRPGSARGKTQVALMMVPLWLSSLLMALAGMWLPPGFAGNEASWRRIEAAVTIWLVLAPLVAWTVSVLVFRARHPARRAVGWELVSLLAAGAIATAMLLFAGIRAGVPWFQAHPAAFVALGIPVFLGVHLLGHALFVGGASLAERGTGVYAPVTEMDREWWGRYSGWVLVAMAGWIGVAGVVMVTPALREWVGAGLAKWLEALGGVSGVVVWLLGQSTRTLSGRRDDQGGGSKVAELALKVAVPLFCVAVAMLLALGTAALGSAIISPALFTGPGVAPGQVLRFLGMIAVLAAVGSLAAAVVNVNRFSLQALYRNRLVRAYLGASRGDLRKPDAFTGFDPADDLFLRDLWQRGGGVRQRPMAVINATLNLVAGQKHLAWQQRKAESFSMTPLYCGNFHDGYRATGEYGGAGGMRLGTAVATSGAAANPNMGFYSSPAVTFLLTLLNGRLGMWLGNPGTPGDATWRLPGPRWALRPMLAELFGFTSSAHPYVNLSDGGHFENLGVYEMVLRRCRYLVVSDAASDPKPGFSDLGNAIRKVRIDFGIPIVFEKTILISPREESPMGLYCATATVRYSAVDEGADPADDGRLIYIKPALFGRGGETVPYDVRAYANLSQTFPHETTADQWFNESQFESYRMLGLHAVQQISSGCGGPGIPGLFAAVDAYMAAKADDAPSSSGTS